MDEIYGEEEYEDEDMSELEEDAYLLGELLGYGGYDELGARFPGRPRIPRAARGRRGRGRASPIRALAKRAARGRAADRLDVRAKLTTPLPGVPGVEIAMLALGFTTVQFVNAGATSLTVTSTPQKPIKGQRLVVDLARTAGAVELVTISTFLIGATNVLPSGQPLSVTAFAANAFHTVLDLPPAGPGIIVTIVYTVSAAPGVGETIDIATTLIGPSVAG